MSGHTPGPWHWHVNHWRGGYSGLYGGLDEEIVVPQTSNDGDTGAAWFEEISDEDRELIAAAPETAAELERAREDIAELVEVTQRLLAAHEATAGMAAPRPHHSEEIAAATTNAEAALAKHARAETDHGD